MIDLIVLNTKSWCMLMTREDELLIHILWNKYTMMIKTKCGDWIFICISFLFVCDEDDETELLQCGSKMYDHIRILQKWWINLNVKTVDMIEIWINLMHSWCHWIDYSALIVYMHQMLVLKHVVIIDDTMCEECIILYFFVVSHNNFDDW